MLPTFPHHHRQSAISYLRGTVSSCPPRSAPVVPVPVTIRATYAHEKHTQMLMILYDRWLPSRQGAHTLLRLISYRYAIRVYAYEVNEVGELVCYQEMRIIFLDELHCILRKIIFLLEIIGYRSSFFIIKFKLLKFLLLLWLCRANARLIVFLMYECVLHEDVISFVET